MFKTAIVLAAAVAASTVSGYATYPQLCGALELANLARVVVTNLVDINGCQARAGGWVLMPPTGVPTIDQQTIMCKNPACDNLLVALQNVKPADCFLSINNSAVGINAKQFIDEYRPFCDLFGQ